MIGMVAAVDLRAGMVALVFVAVLASLIGALAAFAACAASGRADRKMGATEDEVRESARRYADECMRKIREDEAERSAAAVVGDTHKEGPGAKPQRIED